MILLIQNWARRWGGNEKWMLAVAEGMAGRGHEVVVSCRRGGEVARRLEGHGIRTAAASPGVGLNLPRALAFAAWMRRERPDAVLLTSWATTFWGAWAARRAGVPRVVVRLGIVRTPRRAWMVHAFRRWVDALIVNAEEVRHAWRRHAPWFPQERIHLVHNAVQPAQTSRGAAAARLRGEVGVEVDTLLVGAAGHAARRKGFDVLLDAFARAALPRAVLVVAGDGAELPALRSQAEGLGIAERVRWLGHRNDVPAVLSGCGLFVLSSRNEGMANVMLEAMAAGTPVIATDVSGVRTALGPDPAGPAPAGWIVPPGDVDALAAALREVAGLLRDRPGAVRERAAAARSRIRHRFGAERMLAETEAALAGHAPPRTGRVSSPPPPAGVPAPPAPAAAGAASPSPGRS
jgi:glycosyltransferase involved in cell wall biosynthesis